MTKPRSPIPRLSSKRKAQIGKKKVFSTITKKRRSKSEFARIYGSKERVLFVKGLPCICRTTRCDGASENAHIRTGGMGRKSDANNIVPLCHFHHHQLHQNSVRWFEYIYLIDLDAEAKRIADLWLSSLQEQK